MTWQKYKLNLRNSHLLESIMEKFDSMLSPVIDSTLGQEMQQYLRISVQRDSPFADERLFLWRLMRGEDAVTSQLMRHLSYHPTLRNAALIPSSEPSRN